MPGGHAVLSWEEKIWLGLSSRTPHGMTVPFGAGLVSRKRDLTLLLAAPSDFLLDRISDDGAADALTGSSGADWYFAHTSGLPDELDELNGATSSDVITQI